MMMDTINLKFHWKRGIHMLGSRELIIATALVVTPLVAAPSAAQSCESEVVVGNFEFVASDPSYDGSETTFTYCATGIDGDGFHALSHWSLALCTPAEFFASCDTGGEGSCGLDTDPHTGIEGVKFDDIEVEAGETQCFSLTLVGDWTGQVGEVALGLKAAGDVELGLICGPQCDGCVASLGVTALANEIPTFETMLVHQIPPEVTTKIWYRIYNEADEIVHHWTEDAVTFAHGTVYTSDGPIPGLAAPLPPGRYVLKLGVRGMSGVSIVERAFDVPAE